MRPSGPIWRTSLIALAFVSSVGLGAAQFESQSSRLQQGIHLMEGRGDCAGAIEVFEEVAGGEDRDAAAWAMLYMAMCHELLDPSDALDVYERLIERYPDKGLVIAEAVPRLQALQREIQVQPEMGPTGAQLWDKVATSVSPDGRYLPFVDWESASGDIVLYEISTEQSRPVTTDADGSTYGEAPVVSPDGSRVAYLWYDWYQQPVAVELRVANVDGSDVRTVYQPGEVGAVRMAAWSSDGSQVLVFLRRGDGDAEFAFISTADGSVRTVGEPRDHWRSNGIALSPDDRALVYDAPSREDPLQRDIFLLPTDGGDELPLVTGPANEVWPMWAPDGQTILFLSDRSGTMALWAAPIAESELIGEPILVKPDMGRTWPLGVTRAGAFFYLVFLEGSDIYLSEFDAETGERLAPIRRVSALNVGRNLQPAWSPDGTRLAFITRRGWLNLESDRDRLTILDLQTGVQRMLAPDLSVFRRPSWTPDGSAIRVNGSNPLGQYEVDVQTGAVTPLLTDRGRILMPEYSADGTRIYYRQRRLLWEHDFTTGETRQLYDGPWGDAPYPSPDGTQVALMGSGEGYRELLLVPLDSGSVRVLARLEGPQAGGLFHGWSSDGAGLFYSVNSDDGERATLWFMPVDGGEPRQLDVTYTGLELQVHPDGQQVAFTNISPRFAVWMLQDFLPDFSVQR